MELQLEKREVLRAQEVLERLVSRGVKRYER
jgi:hypothetical protein